jgi:hypothetical protein
MKKFFSILSLCLVFFLLSSCRAVTIPNSQEAKEKLEALGYTVSLEIQYGDMVKAYEIDQVTILSADKGDDFIQVYYFTNQEDTNTFYEARSASISRNVEVSKKNKYSIYRGSKSSVEDFLG